MSSIKKNYALNLINTVVGILFPLITFPYVSRILLPDGIGQVQFYNSIIGYISLFTSLGIPLYAVRELARVRNNIHARNKLTIEILTLHGGLTLIGYLIVFLLGTTIGRVASNPSLFFLLSSVLLFNAIGVEWFYQAIEDFKYITIRALTIRILSIITLFYFVKTKEDLIYYAAINVAGTVGNNVFNFIHLRKYIKFDPCYFSQLHYKKHLKFALRLFVLNLIISIYVNLDTIMLGFIKNDTIVGYYAGATRITKTILGVTSSLGAVLLPRFSNLIEEGLKDQFISLADKAISFTIAMVFPMSIGLMLLAKPLILLFCGSAYEASILTLQIISPIIAFIGLSSIIGMQILYPLGKEKIVIISTLIGAIVNFSINLFLIPLYGQNGAAFATVLAELSVILVMFFVGRKHLPFHFFSAQNKDYLIGTLFMATILILFLQLPLNLWESAVFSPLLGVCVYFSYLIFRKDPFYLIIKDFVLKKTKDSF